MECKSNIHKINKMKIIIIIIIIIIVVVIRIVYSPISNVEFIGLIIIIQI